MMPWDGWYYLDSFFGNDVNTDVLLVLTELADSAAETEDSAVNIVTRLRQALVQEVESSQTGKSPLPHCLDFLD